MLSQAGSGLKPVHSGAYSDAGSPQRSVPTSDSLAGVPSVRSSPTRDGGSPRAVSRQHQPSPLSASLLGAQRPRTKRPGRPRRPLASMPAGLQPLPTTHHRASDKHGYRPPESVQGSGTADDAADPAAPVAAAAAEPRGSDGAVSSAHLICGYLTAAEQLGDIHAKLADAAQQMEVAVAAMKRGWNAADDFQVCFHV